MKKIRNLFLSIALSLTLLLTCTVGISNVKKTITPQASNLINDWTLIATDILEIKPYIGPGTHKVCIVFERQFGLSRARDFANTLAELLSLSDGGDLMNYGYYIFLEVADYSYLRLFRDTTYNNISSVEDLCYAVNFLPNDTTFFGISQWYVSGAFHEMLVSIVDHSNTRIYLKRCKSDPHIDFDLPGKIDQSTYLEII